MTLIAALHGPEGIVLAADSRGTIGDPRGLTAINDVQQKLFKLSDYCGITLSGSTELAAKLIDELQAELRKKQVDPKDTDAVMKVSVRLMRDEYTSWFGPRPWVTKDALIDQRPAVIFILAGYVIPKTSGKATARTYLLGSQTDFVPQLCPTGFMLAGIPQYATYLLHRFYDPQMNLQSLQRLAAYLITETASQDPKVGGPVKMASITPSNGYAEVVAGTVDAYIKANEEQNNNLKDFFLKGGVS
jgi:20S proteasome alpha/beta subunit